MAYVTQVDLVNYGFPQSALGTLTNAQINAVLQAASDRADGYFRNRYGTSAVPLLVWDSSVTLAVAQIAAYWLAKVRGFNNANRADQMLEKGFNDAISWLKDVEHQQVTPLVTLSNANAPGSVQPNLTSSSVVNLSSGATAPTRGW